MKHISRATLVVSCCTEADKQCEGVLKDEESFWKYTTGHLVDIFITKFWSSYLQTKSVRHHLKCNGAFFFAYLKNPVSSHGCSNHFY